jgi:hypothetical protein
LRCDDQDALPCNDAHALRVDAGQLHDDGQRVRLVRVEAVDVRPETVPQPGEARHLPEVREQLFDLLLQLVDVASRHVR